MEVWRGRQNQYKYWPINVSPNHQSLLKGHLKQEIVIQLIFWCSRYKYWSEKVQIIHLLMEAKKKQLLTFQLNNIAWYNQM